MTTITEADVEQAGLDWLCALGWRVLPTGRTSPQTLSALNEMTTDRWCLSGDCGTLSPS